MAYLDQVIKATKTSYESADYNENQLYLIGGGDRLLWANPNPNSDFGPTTSSGTTSISFAYATPDIDKFKYVKILFATTSYTADEIIVNTFLNPYNTTENSSYTGRKIDYVFHIEPSGATYQRQISWNSKGTMTVYSGRVTTAAGVTTNPATGSTIPYEIWVTNKP